MVQGKHIKISCQVCIKGHRTKDCNHKSIIEPNDPGYNGSRGCLEVISKKGRRKSRIPDQIGGVGLGKVTLNPNNDKFILIEAKLVPKLNDWCPNSKNFKYECEYPCCKKKSKELYINEETSSFLRVPQYCDLTSIEDAKKIGTPVSYKDLPSDFLHNDVNFHSIAQLYPDKSDYSDQDINPYAGIVSNPNPQSSNNSPLPQNVQSKNNAKLATSLNTNSIIPSYSAELNYQVPSATNTSPLNFNLNGDTNQQYHNNQNNNHYQNSNHINNHYNNRNYSNVNSSINQNQNLINHQNPSFFGVNGSSNPTYNNHLAHNNQNFQELEFIHEHPSNIHDVESSDNESGDDDDSDESGDDNESNESDGSDEESEEIESGDDDESDESDEDVESEDEIENDDDNESNESNESDESDESDEEIEESEKGEENEDDSDTIAVSDDSDTIMIDGDEDQDDEDKGNDIYTNNSQSDEDDEDEDDDEFEDEEDLPKFYISPEQQRKLNLARRFRQLLENKSLLQNPYSNDIDLEFTSIYDVNKEIRLVEERIEATKRNGKNYDQYSNHVISTTTSVTKCNNAQNSNGFRCGSML
ncbi:Midasin [Wickerhamomyces ciferrii]|uniref:Midasin n=1 Tax=Wickerhamomyces ciferrii (strain ATCC 14091 / BCRC 22168 / CBS 111 / JCM 3599 / NBRC 0793 / NRRL Y-1031 F-60-10) TaxID=1206466 RepID=K0KHA4_WICCF|nr:Midasin [Wickerhamomyces ciferrii]CCH40744.1 Midasin [Wickerhamomyces ciferrii]